MKLLIAIPTLDYMHYRFVECLTALTLRLQREKVNFDVKFHGGSLVYISRDRLAEHAINKGYTHVLWLDADMIFTDSLLDDLLFSGKPFVTGIAYGRRQPHMACIFRELAPVERFEDYPNNTFEIAGCGFACVLIETGILRDVKVKEGTCFFPMREFGEDLAFCVRASAMGHKIHAEPGVKVGHIGHNVIWEEDHRRYMDGIRQ